MQKFTAIFLTIFCLTLSTNMAFAQTDLATNLQNKYQQINNMRTKFSQKLSHRESGSVEERQGTLIFEKPLNVRWETQAPHAEMLLITSKEIWNYLPDEEVAYKYTPDVMQDLRTLLEVITGQAKLDEDFEIKPLGKEKNLTVLQLFPYNPTPEMVEAVIGIDPKDMLIKKASIVDFYGNINTMQFENIELNVKLDNKTFSFTPPDGVDVEQGKLQ